MPKTMIFLFDGTANDATQDLFSNVYAINQLIAESKELKIGRTKHTRTQVTFYLPGVGTKFTIRRDVGKKRFLGRGTIDKVRQRFFGDDIEQIILRGYVNLCANYRPGDEIVLIGFSRGAVAARIFSRLISDFGILVSDMILHLDTLWNDFIEISQIRTDPEYREAIRKFETELTSQAGQPVFHTSEEYPIRFLGLFDTVVGSLDNEVMNNVNLRDKFAARGVRHIVHLLSMHDVRKEFELKRFDKSITTAESLREIWIPGVHSDVGGGYEEDFLSNISLLTMTDLLEELAEVEVDKKAYKRIRDEIRSKVRGKRIFINAEPSVVVRQSRTIYDQDEVHPLHWYLIDKFVYWKSFNLTKYEDRLKRQASGINPLLQKSLSGWLRSRV